MIQDEIVKIERIPYSGPVHNLEVENDHSYVVGGVAVHNCLCYKTAVLMKDDAFVDKLKGWMEQGQPWPAMDDYAAWTGAPKKSFDLWDAATVGALAASFLLWLGDDKKGHEEQLAGGGD